MQIEVALYQSLLDFQSAASQPFQSPDRPQQVPVKQMLGTHRSSDAARSLLPLSLKSDFRLAAFRHSTQSDLATADHGLPLGSNAAGAITSTSVGSVPVFSEFYRDAINAQANPDDLGVYEQALLNAYAEETWQYEFEALKTAEKLTKEQVQ